MGPWWMTVELVEAELERLQKRLTALHEERPELAITSAVAHAEAEMQRAVADVRRAARPEGPEWLLPTARATLTTASTALVRAEALGRLAARAQFQRAAQLIV